MLLSLRKIRDDNSGVIMITVLVAVLVMTVVAIGILGVNITQVSTSASVVDNIKAEQLAIGAFYRYHQQKIEGLNGALPTTEVIDNQTYQIDIVETAGIGPNNVNQIEVTIDFGN
jgi:Tfp pilus assembly protein PilV